MSAPLLYTAENNFIGPDIETYRAWYAWRHAPDIWRLGFLSCASYRVIEGDMSVFAIYEIASADVFLSDDYTAIPAKDRYRSRMNSSISQRAHTLYEQDIVPRPADPTAAWQRLDADWISVVRFNSAESEHTLGSRLSQMDKAPGMKRLRLARRSRNNRPNSTTDRPNYMIVAEFEDRPAEGSIAWADFTRHFGTVVTPSSYVTGERLYPWPDHPAN